MAALYDSQRSPGTGSPGEQGVNGATLSAYNNHSSLSRAAAFTTVRNSFRNIPLNLTIESSFYRPFSCKLGYCLSLFAVSQCVCDVILGAGVGDWYSEK